MGLWRAFFQGAARQGTKGKSPAFWVCECDMAKFFIDLHDSNGVIADEEGSEFPHLEDALQEAKASARDLIKQYVDNRLPLSATCVEVRDDMGRTVAALTVAEVLVHPAHPEFQNHCGPGTARDGNLP
jgi:hypothetical protein